MTKAITTSDYDFKGLIDGNQFYADKTDYLHKLATTHKGCFFLSRPRRFGKSLMISTLNYIFQGRRDLFAGLKIDSMGYDWQEYPVVHLNMANLSFSNKEEFVFELTELLYTISRSLNLSLPTRGAPGFLFGKLLLESAFQSPTGQVVLLIDEYDAPLINNINEPYLEEIRKQLALFYIQIKNANSVLRFTMITGVTRFSKVSVFSALNNLKDLTMDAEYATMLGYTQEELEFYFGERIAKLAERAGSSYADYLDRIRQRYNGFCFFPGTATLYNPVSIGEFLGSGYFMCYWFSTANPTLLMKILKERGADYFEILHEEVSPILLDSFDVAQMQPHPLLLQTGYLTFDSMRELRGSLRFTLRYPNSEVEEAFNTHVMTALGTGRMEKVTHDVDRISDAIYAGDTQKMVAIMQAHFAAIPHDTTPEYEANIRSLFFSMFRLVGVNCDAERYSNRGRIDTVIQATEHVYVIEYKYNQSAAAAMDQIHEKRYYEQFQQSGKTIHLLALNYDLTTRNIGGDWFEELM